MGRSLLLSRIIPWIVLVSIFATRVAASPLVAGEVYSTIASANITGEVYLDSNRSDAREPSEAGVANAPVQLRNLQGEMLAEEVTDVDGYYVFHDLNPDTYEVTILAPAGYIVVSNATFLVRLAGVSAPTILSTSVNFGIFLPQVSR